MSSRYAPSLVVALLLGVVVGNQGRADTFKGFASVPVGAIVLWSGSVDVLPSPWQLCDGTNGTPDLRNRFVKCVATGEASGGTGGAASVSYTPAGTNGTAAFTPAGTNSAPAFTGSSGTVSAQTISWPAGVPTAANESAHTHAAGAIAWPAGVPTFAGSALATHTHTYTDVVAHTHTIQMQGGTTAATTGTHIMNSVATGGSSRAATSPDATNSTGIATGTTAATGAGTPAGTVAWPAGVPTGGTSGTGSAHTHVLSWPAGVPTNGTVSFTPTGTVAAPAFTGSAGTVPGQTFTGTGATIATEPAYYKLAYIMRLQ